MWLTEFYNASNFTTKKKDKKMDEMMNEKWVIVEIR
jgi:hypothetical protein